MRTPGIFSRAADVAGAAAIEADDGHADVAVGAGGACPGRQCEGRACVERAAQHVTASRRICGSGSCFGRCWVQTVRVALDYCAEYSSELRAQRVRFRLAFCEVETVTEFQGVPFRDLVVALAVLVTFFEALEVMQAEGIYCEKPIIPGMPRGGRPQVGRMAEDDHADRIALGIGTVVADPVRLLAPDVLLFVVGAVVSMGRRVLVLERKRLAEAEGHHAFLGVAHDHFAFAGLERDVEVELLLALRQRGDGELAGIGQTRLPSAVTHLVSAVNSPLLPRSPWSRQSPRAPACRSPFPRSRNPCHSPSHARTKAAVMLVIRRFAATSVRIGKFRTTLSPAAPMMDTGRAAACP